MKTITLKCQSCGSNLQISLDMDQFACAHCGTAQIVERSGGTISLRRMVESINQVQRGTDKTAAELALNRLPIEIRQLTEHRAARISYYEKCIEEKVKLLNVASIAIGLGIFALALFVSNFLATRFLVRSLTDVGAVVGLVIGGISGFVARAKLGRLSRFEYVSLREHKDLEISEITKRICSIEQKLQENYRIANA